MLLKNKSTGGFIPVVAARPDGWTRVDQPTWYLNYNVQTASYSDDEYLADLKTFGDIAAEKEVCGHHRALRPIHPRFAFNNLPPAHQSQMRRRKLMLQDLQSGLTFGKANMTRELVKWHLYCWYRLDSTEDKEGKKGLPYLREQLGGSVLDEIQQIEDRLETEAKQSPPLSKAMRERTVAKLGGLLPMFKYLIDTATVVRAQSPQLAPLYPHPVPM